MTQPSQPVGETAEALVERLKLAADWSDEANKEHMGDLLREAAVRLAEAEAQRDERMERLTLEGERELRDHLNDAERRVAALEAERKGEAELRDALNAPALLHWLGSCDVLDVSADIARAVRAIHQLRNAVIRSDSPAAQGSGGEPS